MDLYLSGMIRHRVIGSRIESDILRWKHKNSKDLGHEQYCSTVIHVSASEPLHFSTDCLDARKFKVKQNNTFTHLLL
jgi:hypothetical protein